MGTEGGKFTARPGNSANYHEGMIEMATKACELRDVFIANVKARRKALGLTQTDVANAVGCKQPYYCAIERGHVSPGLELIERIAEALQIAPSELMEARTAAFEHSE